MPTNSTISLFLAHVRTLHATTPQHNNLIVSGIKSGLYVNVINNISFRILKISYH
ncbi:hypothetical protein LSH36_299g03037 [Paralvinella palmiformis]|uniref:Uncharacterized protein n=1 Tax=Paralvinella palmiformis TaxID=53620 RepID=A0AAD9JIL2_9ANNE|nr:hypothetical protein LSH36_299g03037 [Paralvinella palmiformis]